MPSRATVDAEHTVAVVVPVYRGDGSLPTVVDELETYASRHVSPGGSAFRVIEVILVHDGGPDSSDVVIRELARRHAFVRPVWLARNYGQHAATLAGMSSTSADWIVTMDEDGQHDPDAIGAMLDTALSTRSPLVYARPTNKAPHGALRNLASRVAHLVARLLGAGNLSHFHSYRLVLGEIGRGLAAYCGEGVYLDVALSWVVSRTASHPVAMRDEHGRPSGYTFRQLVSHFWRMVLTSGTRPLRLVALFGAALGVSAFGLMGWVVWARVTDEVPVAGWTSVMVVLLAVGGGTLLSLGIVAEYLGIAARSAMGKPLYLVVSDPVDGPLGRSAAPLGTDSANSASATDHAARAII
jgi:polyisoprenyl-phosphate glycosyltransferase